MTTQSGQASPAPLRRLVSRVLMFLVFVVLVLSAFVIGCLAYPATATIWFMWGCYVGDQDNIKYCLDPFDFAVWTARKLRAKDDDAIAANSVLDRAVRPNTETGCDGPLGGGA